MNRRIKKDRPPPKPTKERLAEDLLIFGAPRAMIDAAKAGRYDDYESDSATPIMDLVRDCEALGLTRMAQWARDGKYDGTKAEADAWAKSPEGQEVFRRLREGR